MSKMFSSSFNQFQISKHQFAFLHSSGIQTLSKTHGGVSNRPQWRNNYTCFLYRHNIKFILIVLLSDSIKAVSVFRNLYIMLSHNKRVPRINYLSALSTKLHSALSCLCFSSLHSVGTSQNVRHNMERGAVESWFWM